MSKITGDRVKQTAEAEHIGPEYTGDNISAKKVALYEALDGVNWSRKGTPTATRIDDSAGTTIYIGKAPIGSATSAAVWQIAKLDTSSGLIKTWSDGDSLFNNIWDNRASLEYS
jgi:hypothetical protein